MKSTKSNWLLLLQLAVFLLSAAVASGQLRADFSASPRSGCPPMVVVFKDSSTGNPNSWKWDLGNGTISYLQNPIATYFDPGTYNIKLVVKNASGADSIVKSQYITVNALPAAAFNVSDTMGCYPLKVHFDDLSNPGSGNITSWQWDFGDGSLSSEQSPLHTYTSSGTFSVTLRVTNSFGCSKVITKNALIKIQNGVKAAFISASSQGCQTSAPVTFINQSTGTGTLQYLWNFGNGNTSTLKDPVINYGSTGSYTVRLIVTSSFGCKDTLIKPNAINIGVVNANFTRPDTVCTGAAFQMTNTSSPSSFVGSKWFVGDSCISTLNNPFHSFNTPGTHQVKLVTDFGSCRDSVTRSIVSMPKPNVAFTATNNYSCKAPLTVSFNNTSVNAVSYQWNFGDGGTSSVKNPTHTYTAGGNYTVSLIVVNSLGCTDTLTLDSLVKIAPPKILSMDSLKVRGCVPYPIHPTANISSGLPVTYLWEFGDGNTSNSPTPAHTYTTTGVFNVKLTITTASGCKDTMTVIEAVKAGNLPTPNFSATPLSVCANTAVDFTDLSTGGPITGWYWDFGDGTTLFDVQNPSHMYNDTGWFNVTFVPFSQGCSDTIVMENYIYVRPPIAKFDTAYLCSSPLKRNFIDSSIGATSWAWDFGDGGTSSQRNPAHTYAASGTYQVALTVSDGLCQHTRTKNVMVLKQNGKMIVSDSIACRNTRLVFNVSNMEPGSIQKYKWFFNGFGNPSINTSNAPVAQSYTTAGTRNPAVIVTDVLQCQDTLYTTVPMIVYGPKVIFGSDVPGSCFGTTINFLDSSYSDGIHPISSWTWDFGDGPPQTLTSGPFSHDYTSAGIYSVSLVIKDTYGCKDSINKPAMISVSQLNADFSPSDTMICPSSPVVFSNNSIGSDVTYKWTFGDNTTSTVAIPVHSFVNPGTYNVNLFVADKIGCSDSVSKTIHVYAAKADFAISDSFSTCPPLVVNTTNNSTNYVNFNWDFGDGSYSTLLNPSHIYTYPGNYKITLAVSNTGGCTDTLRRNINIKGPTGSFGYIPTQVCNPGMVRYSITSQNAVSFVWDFNDGTTIYSNKDTASHIYYSPGIYVPKVILEDGSGCKVAITGLDTVKVTDISTHILTSTRLLCDSGFISFSDSTITNDVVSGYLWDFGDGFTTTVPNPTHTYTTTGLFTVTLTANTSFGCTDTAVVQDCIKIAGTPKVKITGDSLGCEPAQLSFAGSLVRPDTSAIQWNWIFDNGNFASGQMPPSQMYNSPGTYNIRLMALNPDGCADTAYTKAVVLAKPVVDAGPDALICKDQNYTLHASGATSYTWSASPFISCINCANPVVNPNTKNTFYVTGSNGIGCSGTDSVTIDVRQPFTLSVSPGGSVCQGQSLTMGATGADTYQWSPSLWLSNPSIANPETRPDTNMTYMVIGEDNAKCFKDTGYVNVKVYPIPTVDITNGNAINLQIGSSVKLTTKVSPDVTGYAWSPGVALSCASCSEPITSTREDITYTVTVKNAGNCIATDKISVSMICENANVFVPNTFSPNGDGMNDVFYPRGAGLGNVRSFRIFNRWGQVVFQKQNFAANDPTQGWDGKVNNIIAPSDVYVYMVEVVCSNNQIIPFKGNVTLVR